MRTRRWLMAGAAVVAVMVTMGASCSSSPGSAANKTDQATAAKTLEAMQKNQPVPVFTYSQLRQNLIEIETAQAQTTQTTSFLFNQGVANPITICPSIGFPIPSTYQITNPESLYTSRNGNVTQPQVEANGIYTGDSTGTYVMCVDATGKPYAVYWEGFVQTVTGPAVWKDGQVQLVGTPSFAFSTGEKKK